MDGPRKGRLARSTTSLLVRMVFQTPRLESAVEVTGPIAVKLWISSDRVDTDFTAKLIDVHPANEDYAEGYAMNLVDSVLRVRFRESFEHEVFMRPGTVYPIEITLAPTSNLFKAGHRLRLDRSHALQTQGHLQKNSRLSSHSRAGLHGDTARQTCCAAEAA